MSVVPDSFSGVIGRRCRTVYVPVDLVLLGVIEIDRERHGALGRGVTRSVLGVVQLLQCGDRGVDRRLDNEVSVAGFRGFLDAFERASGAISLQRAHGPGEPSGNESRADDIERHQRCIVVANVGLVSDFVGRCRSYCYHSIRPMRWNRLSTCGEQSGGAIVTRLGRDDFAARSSGASPRDRARPDRQGGAAPNRPSGATSQKPQLQKSTNG